MVEQVHQHATRMGALRAVALCRMAEMAARMDRRIHLVDGRLAEPEIAA